MNYVLELLRDTAFYVLGTLLHNWPALAIGVLVAAAMTVYVDPERMRNWMLRLNAVSIPATVAFGAFTPFCACGTMAVVISMVATALPWGPIMAFLTSSPLMSPEEFVLLSGIVSPTFAIALAASSVLIGIGSGVVTHVIERKTRFFDGQLRLSAGKDSQPVGCACTAPKSKLVQASACSCADEAGEGNCGCGGVEAADGCAALAMESPVRFHPVGGFLSKYRINKFFKAVLDVGVLRILPFFALFAAIGYLINRFIPSQWISALFGQNSVFAVPLAALLGLPLYVNGDSSVPLIQQLMASGVSPGAMLAFMITGPGTSAGVLAGLATIMKKKAIALYAAYLLAGAILLGYAYELLTALIGF